MTYEGLVCDTTIKELRMMSVLPVQHNGKIICVLVNCRGEKTVLAEGIDIVTYRKLENALFETIQ